MCDKRLQELVFNVRTGVSREAQQCTLAWPIDISIEQTHACAVGCKCDRKIDRNRRFTDATFAGGYGDNMLDIVELELVYLCADKPSLRHQFGTSEKRVVSGFVPPDAS